ncbi:MAG: hypothetical protein HQK83_15055 [Fibrobacteria bacterium]|nr:hypothetical protein [Fibrobacteria bacterium]
MKRKNKTMYKTAGLLRPVVFVFLISAYACPLFAAPLIWAESRTNDNTLYVSLKGKEISEAKSIRVKFRYDKTAFNIMDAIISSKIPGVAFGAFADTGKNELVILLVGVSPITIEDNAILVTLNIPSNSNVNFKVGFELFYGVVIDKNNSLHIAVPGTSTRRPIITASSDLTKTANGYSLSGRKLPRNNHTPGIRVYTYKSSGIKKLYFFGEDIFPK